MLDDRNDNEKYVLLSLTKIFCNLFGLGSVLLISVVVVDVVVVVVGHVDSI